MQRLNPFRLYEIGIKLHALADTHEQNVSQFFGPLTEAQKILDTLIKGDPIELNIARTPALQLQRSVSSIFDKYFIDPNSQQLRMPSPDLLIDPQDMILMQAQLEQFDQALAADMSRTISYRASQRGIFSTRALMERASAAIPQHLRAAVPQGALAEIDEAGRCLGFGMGTAACMHLIRSIEQTVAEYYTVFAPPLTSKAERNLAHYLRKLESLLEEDADKKPDTHTLALLQQIKDRYRNPVVDVSVQLSVDDATILFNLTISVMIEMAAAMPLHREATLPFGPKLATSEMESFLADEQDEAYDFEPRPHSRQTGP